MNKYRITPRLGQPLTVFNDSESGARHVAMTVVYGPAFSPWALNHGLGLAVTLEEPDVQPPTKGTYVYQDPKPEKAPPDYSPKVGWTSHKHS